MKNLGMIFGKTPDMKGVMKEDLYDSNKNGVVDNAENANTLGGKTANAFASSSNLLVLWNTVDKIQEKINNPNQTPDPGYITMYYYGELCGTHTKTWDGILEYSMDEGNSWTEWFGDEISVDGKILFRGQYNTVISNQAAVFNCLEGGSSLWVEGNIENLLDYKGVLNGEHPKMGEYAFHSLFKNNANLIHAPELNSVELAPYCYGYMFAGCDALHEPPTILPALIVPNKAYRYMFNDSGIRKTPIMPAIQYLEEACRGMFYECAFLEEPTELRAIELSKSCYDSMFADCPRIKRSPVLPAMIVPDNAYESMFNGCSSLVDIGFIGGIGFGEHACQTMFENCSSLTRIPALLVHNAAHEAFYGMLQKTAVEVQTSKTSTCSRAFIFIETPAEQISSIASTAFDNMFYNSKSGISTPTPKQKYYTTEKPMR